MSHVIHVETRVLEDTYGLLYVWAYCHELTLRRFPAVLSFNIKIRTVWVPRFIERLAPSDIQDRKVVTGHDTEIVVIVRHTAKGKRHQRRRASPTPTWLLLKYMLLIVP